METAIIVLGHPPNEDGTIPFNLKTRLDLAITEYLNNDGSKLIMTGGSVYGQIIEAVKMKEYCVDKGISESDILMETKARSTYDNALYTAKILKENHADKIIVITSRFHRYRTNIIFKHYFSDYLISIPELTSYYLLRNLHIYIFEFYLTVKLIIKGDKRLKREILNYICLYKTILIIV
ncbi:MAG: YdcF family protein [Spirochaetales bacterium]|nr:YdcF family protein [Spirochaetales bacterium]